MAAQVTAPLSEPPRPLRESIPSLENGEHLSAVEFLRRYEGMPEVKKAELIAGTVYLASPVRYDQHAEPDSIIQGWLWTYSVATPGAKSAVNSTLRLGPDDVPQPDGLLRLVPECGGQSWLDDKGYLRGAPELVAEVAASSASLDTREKLTTYRRAGVREYLVWRMRDRAVDWWELADDEYRLLPADEGGRIRSRVFPGLWLDTRALLVGDGEKVLTTLHAGLQSPEHLAFVAHLRQPK